MECIQHLCTFHGARRPQARESWCAAAPEHARRGLGASRTPPLWGARARDVRWAPTTAATSFLQALREVNLRAALGSRRRVVHGQAQAPVRRRGRARASSTRLPPCPAQARRGRERGRRTRPPSPLPCPRPVARGRAGCLVHLDNDLEVQRAEAAGERCSPAAPRAASIHAGALPGARSGSARAQAELKRGRGRSKWLGGVAAASVDPHSAGIVGAAAALSRGASCELDDAGDDGERQRHSTGRAHGLDPRFVPGSGRDDYLHPRPELSRQSTRIDRSPSATGSTLSSSLLYSSTRPSSAARRLKCCSLQPTGKPAVRRIVPSASFPYSAPSSTRFEAQSKSHRSSLRTFLRRLHKLSCVSHRLGRAGLGRCTRGERADGRACTLRDTCDALASGARYVPHVLRCIVPPEAVLAVVYARCERRELHGRKILRPRSSRR
jgi:hypothetical protein